MLLLLDVQKLKEQVEIVQSIVSTAAILVAGFWTYNTFIRERRHVAHATVTHRVCSQRQSDKVTLLDIEAAIENTSSTRLISSRYELRISQVYPIICGQGKHGLCLSNILENSLLNRDQVLERFAWPTIYKSRSTGDFQISIEPNETHVHYLQAVIPSNVKVVSIYTEFHNDTLRGSDKKFFHLTNTLYDVPELKLGELSCQ